MSYPKYQFDAALLDDTIKTTVDSTEARYYLIDYLQCSPLIDYIQQ